MASTLMITCVQRAGEALVVDGGRPGYRALGLASGGAADPRAQASANRLLGRHEQAPCLEFGGAGGQWLLSGNGQFTLTGADMNWQLNGRLLEAYQVQYLEGDGLLTATSARRGNRAYLAIAGEWSAPQVLGSYEPGLPGIPPLLPGWTAIVRAPSEAPFRTSLDVDQHWPAATVTLPMMPGPEWALIGPALQGWLTQTSYRVSPSSNRQGIRLDGGEPPPLKLAPLLSSPVLPGTVQLTPGGPILLGPASQTVGGYPRVLLTTNPDDLALAHQLRPGEELRFSVSL